MSTVVIVGAGHAGVQVAAALRSKGFGGPITIVDEDPNLPYQRPPLSKDFVADQGADPLPLRADKFYTDNGIELRTRVRVAQVDRSRRRVHLDDGTVLPYSTLVLATGAANRPLDLDGTGLRGVHSLRTLDDAEALCAGLSTARSVVVVGAGFIGLEFAAAARKRGVSVTVLEAADRPLKRAVSADLSSYVADAHRRMGTDLRLEEGLGGLTGHAGHVTAAASSSGREYAADLVLLGVGVVPRDELARAASLDVDNGVVVDQFLRTSDPAIYAVGDCANYPLASGSRLRLESIQNATDQARHVADGILGRRAPYSALPLFWSNQGPLRLQIAGMVGSYDHTIASGDVAGSRFSICCFRDERLVAVESMNRPADHMAARVLLRADHRPSPEAIAAPGFSLKDHVKQHAAAS